MSKQNLDIEVEIAFIASDACHAAASLHADDNMRYTEHVLKQVIERTGKALGMVVAARAMKEATCKA